MATGNRAPIDVGVGPIPGRCHTGASFIPSPAGWQEISGGSGRSNGLDLGI
jgi:hypothetical protein